MFYLFPLVLPYTKGNVVKTFIVGLVVLTIGLYLVTNIAPAFTRLPTMSLRPQAMPPWQFPLSFEGGALDFASSPLAWVIYQCSCNLKWVGAGILIAITLVMTIRNRILIIRNQKAMIAKNSDELQKQNNNNEKDLCIYPYARCLLSDAGADELSGAPRLPSRRRETL